jgi:carbamoyl-phosphate synthase large subunit
MPRVPNRQALAPVRTINVLVTGVGAIIGYGIVRALKACRFDVNVMGIDVHPDAVGQRWCDDFRQAIWAADPGYADFLADIMDEKHIDLVMFGVEEEIFRVCDDRSMFRGDFAKLVLNDPELIRLSRDKWLLYEHLVANGLKSIRTLTTKAYDVAAKELGLPCLVKPRRSTASKGIVVVHSRDDFQYWSNRLGEEFMIQEIVGDEDHEYTVGVFGLGDGSFSQSFAFARKLSREGSTSKAQTVAIPELDEQVRQLTALLAPVGPTNFQFRRHGDDYLLLEVNPRFSSSLSMRAAFGFNEPEMCIEYFVEHVRPQPRVTTRGSAVRYIEDAVRFA